MDLIVQQHLPQLFLFVLVQVILVTFAELRICVYIAETQAQIVLIDGYILEYTSSLEVLDCSSGASHNDTAIDVLVADMFEYILDTFDAGTPATNHTQENVIREISADLALAHVVMQLGEGQRHFHE